MKPKSIVLGSDVRLTSESLKLALAKGLQDAGSDVIDIGLTGTEEIYFATTYLKRMVAWKSPPAITLSITTA